MKKTGMQFSEVLDAVDALQFGEQEELIEIVRRRQAEWERKRIVAQIKRSRREFTAGKFKEATPEDVMRDLAYVGLIVTAILSFSSFAEESVLEAGVRAAKPNPIKATTSGDKLFDKSVRVAKINSESASSGMVLSADGNGGATWAASIGTTITGNFVGSLTGNVVGNVTGNVSGTALGFSSSLAGDVTGTQTASVVSSVSGVAAVNVASGANAANTATNLNLPGTLVKRDANGNFNAGVITGNLVGNVLGSATSFSGSLAGDLTGTQSAAIVSSVGGVSAFNIASGATAANGATVANTPNTIVKRDANGNIPGAVVGTVVLSGDVTGPTNSNTVSFVGGVAAISIASAVTLANASTNVGTPNSIVKRDANGNFAAGTITAGLVGDVTGNVSGTALNFAGILNGDVTGTQSATVVSTLGGIAAVDIASAVNAVNSASTANTPNSIVKRDANGNIVGNANAVNFSGSLAGNVTGTQSATVVSSVGGVSAANLASGASLANAATTASTPNTIVKRDSSGNIPGVPSGVLSQPIRTIVSFETLTAADYTVVITGNGAILPTAVGIAGRIYILKNRGAPILGAEVKTANTSEYIDDTQYIYPLGTNTVLVIQSDGKNWIKIN